MKKILSIIIMAAMLFSVTAASAQTVDSDTWGIKFDLSDNWQLDSSKSDFLSYYHKYDSSEQISVSYDAESIIIGDIRSNQSDLDEFFDDYYSNAELADNITTTNGARVTVSENYYKKRFESYNGVEYYRAEKLYTAKAYNVQSTYFYQTSFATIQNAKLYCITYLIKGSSAKHFSDVTALLNSLTYKTGVGSVVGFALKTDITAKINGHAIPSYNVNGYTYIVAEDLRYYGFDVYFDNASRTLAINRDWSQSQVSGSYSKPYVAPSEVGTPEFALLATDIVTYLNNSYVQSYNIDGKTIIPFDALNANGAVSYDDYTRTISLQMSGIN